MTDVVVLVDAGYLFAQGAKVLSGQTVARSRLRLEVPLVVTKLTEFAVQTSPGCRLLRIYWYDGSASGRLSSGQDRLANSDNIKLRLGQINSAGQQKGVDSLIVTDLIELARNRVISDAVLLSGDEDVRVGVQIAQNYGVRIHLLGIEGAANSQSPQLYQEADTTSHLSKTEVETFLTVSNTRTSPATISASTKSSEALRAGAAELAAILKEMQLEEFAEFRKKNNSIPSDLDGRLLAMAREKIGRDLERPEIKTLRAAFVEAMKARDPALFTR